MKILSRSLIVLLLVCALPAFASPTKVVKKKKKAHVTATATVASPGPKTVSAKAVHHVKHVGHKISYNTWRLTHPNQARAEYDAERAADAKREAADRKHEAEYKAAHK